VYVNGKKHAQGVWRPHLSLQVRLQAGLHILGLGLHLGAGLLRLPLTHPAGKEVEGGGRAEEVHG
jgi:hypothetical protein